jgi:hypothetical protein
MAKKLVGHFRCSMGFAPNGARGCGVDIFFTTNR